MDSDHRETESPLHPLVSLVKGSPTPPGDPFTFFRDSSLFQDDPVAAYRDAGSFRPLTLVAS